MLPLLRCIGFLLRSCSILGAQHDSVDDTLEPVVCLLYSALRLLWCIGFLLRSCSILSAQHDAVDKLKPKPESSVCPLCSALRQLWCIGLLCSCAILQAQRDSFD